MYLNYTSLTINNHILQGQEIISYCRNAHDEALLAVADFMEEWLNPSPEIHLRTSGSTGTPKIITVRKDQLLASATMTATYFDFKEGQKALLCLPVHYIAGKMMIVRALNSGLNLICVNPSSNPLESLSPDVEIDFAAMIPMQLQQVKDLPALSQIRTLLLGGGPVDAVLEQTIQDLPTQIYHGYGMTETFSHIALRKVNGKDASTVFKALKGISLAQDDRGCLVINAPLLLEESLTTNDVVELHSPDEFIWKGRFDHVINSGGIKIFPEELEKKLHPLLNRRFYFMGVPDAKLGQKLVLMIEGESMEKNELEALQAEMKIHFNKYELPKEIRFLREFEETESGKVRRRY
ncbi:MAG: AMP-binding protein [Ginsengibacter sp.]